MTVHYFEYSSNYYFEGERHDFWEFLYVDKGEVYVVAEGREELLSRGDIIFHPPGEFHALRATGNSAPNLVVASFYCDCSELERLSGRTYKTKEAERVLIGGLVSEAELAFRGSASTAAGGLSLFLMCLAFLAALPQREKGSKE